MAAAKFSAYLSIYNDWDLLPATLASIGPYIDELVVVDGAYAWMLPYLSGIAKDPLRSDPRVYQAIEASGIRYRVVSDIWSSEIEKRKAGYTACANRFIFRVDADEIYYMNPARLEQFLAAGGAAAEMEMPLYAAPGWIIAQPGQQQPERQGFLFDSEQVNADQHLFYLWLVAALEGLPPGAANRPPVFPEPIAYNAHLSNWRTPVTSVNRAAFYMLNWIRANGVPWLTEFRGQPLHDLAPLFSHVRPGIFLDTLKGHSIVMGHEPLGDRILKPSPLPAAADEGMAPLFDNFLLGHVRLNEELHAYGRAIIGNTHIDLSSADAQSALAVNGALAFRLSAKIAGGRAALSYLLADEPWQVVRTLGAEIDDEIMRLPLPIAADEPPHWLRRILNMEVHSADGLPVQRLTIAT